MELGVFKTFAEALAIGLLIGSERYKDRGEGEHQSAGLRTFSIISLLGAACGLMASSESTLVTFAALVVFLAFGYYRDPTQSFGLTTEMTALLTFWLGYLLKDYEILAISTGIVVVILLASKKPLHDFVRNTVSEREFFDTLKFLAIVFVVFPLLPNRHMGPMGFLNPAQLWKLIILVAAISYAGYVLMKILGDGKGLIISALLGGIVSTTAVTLSLAERTRQFPAFARLFGTTAVAANTVQLPRLILLVWVVDGSLGRALAIPFLAMFGVGVIGAWALTSFRNKENEVAPVSVMLQNPFSLGPVLKFGLFFVAVFFFSRGASEWFGSGGTLIASALAGLGSVSAIALSVADMVSRGTLSPSGGVQAVFVAVASNMLLKWILSLINGGRELAFWLGLGLVGMFATGVVIFLFSVP